MEEQENPIHESENQENNSQKFENQDNNQESEEQESNYQEFEEQENVTSDDYGQFNAQVPVPNSTLILILGIASIVTCCCYGIIGIICSIITIVLAKTAKQIYEENPALYTASSYSNINAGRICAIIGLVMSALYIIMMIVIMIIYGAAALTNPELFMNQ